MNLQFETWPIERCIEYARNPRKNDHAVDKVAAAIKEYGFRVPIVAKSDGLVVDGHLRLKAAKKLGLTEVPVILADDMTDAQIKAFRLSVNRVAQEAQWDNDLLKIELQDLDANGFDLSLTGFEVGEIAAFLTEPTAGLTDEDAVPEVPVQPVTVLGDVWLMGNHRVMCGDSTVITDLERLMAGAKAALMHADPPYGMGKEKDGVENDNLHNDDLDSFQMEWWATLRPFLLDNASAYIWGNAPELWRLWYKAGLGSSELMELRNQIVWDKKAIPGMASADLNQYPVASEHCLFFQLGNQLIGNMNTADYWEGFEPIRAYLEQEMKSIGWKLADLNRATDSFMGGHWVTRSQWAFPTAEQYGKIKSAAAGKAFKREYDQLKREYDQLKRETRSYFDNAHDAMRDVWEFSRVNGEERHGHATPKPVAMMQRVMLSSLPKGGLCVEPFGGSGSTLMGAERTDRVCYAMELTPAYVDVIVKRWQDFTGKIAVLESTGEPFPQATNG